MRLLFIICHKACGVSLGLSGVVCLRESKRGEKREGKAKSEIMFLSSFTCRGGELSASGLVEHMTSLFSFNFLASLRPHDLPQTKNGRKKKFLHY